MDLIKQNIDVIKKNIEQAAEKSGRKASDVLLLAVTKTIDVDRIKQLMNLGIKTLGENKPQELVEKYKIIGNDAQWHLIGHLQTNKVKYIVDKVSLIHSVDSFKLAAEIDKQAKKINKVMDILIEVNIAQEESKYGVKADEVENLIDEIKIFDNICIKGLMTVAPFVENPQNNRVYFKQMHNLFVDINKKKHDNINMMFLSMGMTNDYKIAIEEGANIVRIGTGIFGARNYN